MPAKGALFTFLLLVFTACLPKDSQVSLGKEVQSAQQVDLNLPAYFPEFVNHNKTEFTKERVDLGKKLFFETKLSKDNSISCASCHVPENSFSDPKPVSVGVGGGLGFRNAPALINMPLKEHFFRDGGVSTLELTVLVPFDSHVEFNLDIYEACEKLSYDKSYVEMFQLAFGTEPTPFALSRSISSFVKTLLHYNSAYDKYTYQNQTNALNDAAKRGLDLFFSDELKCASCHSGFNFTNNAFENNGLKTDYSNDPGRNRLTFQSSDIGKFQVPTLRNITYTAPYMHDGSKSTLLEVINHYAGGGSNHLNKSNLISGFSISESQKQDLIAFFESLGDEDFMKVK